MPKIKEPQVGVVILTRNRKGYMKQCLTSLRKNKYLHKEIVIIDDDTGTGFARGNNKGIRLLLKKKCDYILLLNDDTVVDPRLISTLVSKLQTDSTIGIIGPTISYFDMPEIIWYSGGLFNKLFCFTTHPHMNTSVHHASSGYTDFVTGCGMMVKRQVFEEVGLLDTRFGYYFEDSFFCIKAGYKGYRSYVLKDVLIKHHVSSSLGITGSNRMSPLRAYFYARNPFIFIKDEDKLIFKLTQILGQLCIRLPYYTVSILHEGNISSFPWYLRGLRDGFWYLWGGRLRNQNDKKIK